LALTSPGLKFDRQVYQDLREDAGRSDLRRLSLSGHERNHLFFNVRGEAFFDLGAVFGLDDPADSRSFAVLDYDRDGWQDLAVVNTNAPLLRLYHNRIAGKAGSAGGMIALRFVGANRRPSPAPSSSNRDGYGAKVTVWIEGQPIVREHRAGEGFAAQNSATMIIGLGQRAEADSVVVRWPSGTIRKTGRVRSGTLLTALEQPVEGRTFLVDSYARNAGAGPTISAATVHPTVLRIPHGGSDRARLHLYTTMATWCAACERELPQVARLRAEFSEDAVALFGVPVDDRDDPGRLQAYVAKHRPAYELLEGLSPEHIVAVRRVVKDELKLDGLPATIVTDGDGNVLRTLWGVPSVSEIRRQLEASR
jgi:thiol-disulfide isomerase/thioredoxin